MKGVEGYFKGLADITRLRIVNLLLRGELCGCDIQYVIGTAQSNVSRHLTYLKRSGLVHDRREGFRIYYRLLEQNNSKHIALISYLKSALTEKVFVADRKQLAKAVKAGACSISELKAGLVSPRSARQTNLRR
ncbi:MAG: metalloregulator ArsR/SmtB family transcription factor [Acidobacteriia bacterium]|nr:metalloregulator ArsR/SmtB family transcription factor [Terriglobia bacterium]